MTTNDVAMWAVAEIKRLEELEAIMTREAAALEARLQNALLEREQVRGALAQMVALKKRMNGGTNANDSGD